MYNYVVFVILTVLVNFCLFLTRNKWIQYSIIITSLIISFTLLFVGSRTVPLSVLMVIFYWLSKKYRLSASSIIIALAGGILLMYIVGQLRVSGISSDSLSNLSDVSESDIGMLDALSDLIGVNRNNYLAYYYVKNNSITYGLTWVGNMLAAVPFAANIFCAITGVQPYALGTASFLTYQEFGKNPPMGVGSNIVADVYLAFGFIGVVVLFYLFGRLVTKARNKAFKEGSLKWSLILMFLVSDAVFINRGMILEIFRPIIWSYLIIMFVKKIKHEKCFIACSFKSRNNSKML